MSHEFNFCRTKIEKKFSRHYILKNSVDFEFLIIIFKLFCYYQNTFKINSKQ